MVFTVADGQTHQTVQVHFTISVPGTVLHLRVGVGEPSMRNGRWLPNSQAHSATGALPFRRDT